MADKLQTVLGEAQQDLVYWETPLTQPIALSKILPAMTDELYSKLIKLRESSKSDGGPNWYNDMRIAKGDVLLPAEMGSSGGQYGQYDSYVKEAARWLTGVKADERREKLEEEKKAELNRAKQREVRHAAAEKEREAAQKVRNAEAAQFRAKEAEAARQRQNAVAKASSPAMQLKKMIDLIRTFFTSTSKEGKGSTVKEALAQFNTTFTQYELTKPKLDLTSEELKLLRDKASAVITAGNNEYGKNINILGAIGVRSEAGKREKFKQLEKDLQQFNMINKIQGGGYRKSRRHRKRANRKTKRRTH